MQINCKTANIVIERYKLKIDKVAPGDRHEPFIEALIHKLEDMQDRINWQDSIINNSCEVELVCRQY